MLWIVGGLIALGAAAYRYWRNERRRHEMQAFATRAGLRYAANDPFGTVQLGFRLFREGDGRGVDNVCWGTTGGFEVRLFDYWYYEQTRDDRGHTHRTYRYHSCTLFRIPGIYGPRLTVEPEGVFSRLKDAIGFRDLQFESEDFNRAFQITAAGDERFAYAVLDAGMMDWLLNAGRQHRIETMGNVVLVSTSRVPAAGLWSLLSVARGFRDRVPDVVSELYPAAEHQGHDDLTSMPTPVLPDLPSSDDSIVPKWTL
ncbi:MAG: hypothetical protein KY437_03650 [Actinobacteria bacterium]|nr:hypothetical protein [Actinomycetota bacterium]